MPLMRTRVNCGPEAAHRNLPALAGVAADRDAGHALDGFRQVEVGELADVLGQDGVGGGVLGALVDQRPLEAAAEAGDHDLSCRAAAGVAARPRQTAAMDALANHARR
jgi:hypothetical protein